MSRTLKDTKNIRKKKRKTTKKYKYYKTKKNIHTIHGGNSSNSSNSSNSDNTLLNVKVLNNIMDSITTFQISNYIDMIKNIVNGEQVQISLWFFIKNIFKYRSIKSEFSKIVGYINTFDYVKLYHIFEKIIIKIKQLEDNKDTIKLYNLYFASIASLLYLLNDKHILEQIEKEYPELLTDISYFQTLINTTLLNEFLLEIKEKKVKDIDIETNLELLIVTIYRNIIEYINYEVNKLNITNLIYYYQKILNTSTSSTSSTSINLNTNHFTVLFELLLSLSREQFTLLKKQILRCKDQLLHSISHTRVLTHFVNDLLDERNNEKQFELLNKIRTILKNVVELCSSNSSNSTCSTYIKTAESFEALFYLMTMIIVIYYYKKHTPMFIIQGGKRNKNSKNKNKF
jgi:hypothetical protein